MRSFLDVREFQIRKLWILLFVFIFSIVPLSFLNYIFIWTIFIFVFFFFLCSLLDIKNFSFYLFGIAFSIRIIIIMTIDTPPVSDFECLLSASQRLLEGDTSFVNEVFFGTKYFQIWAYQLGYVVFQTGLLWIWNSVIMLQLFNCLIGAGTTVLVYLIAREICGEQASQVMALVYCFYLFPLTYVTVLSNQFIATFLVYLGIYLLLSQNVKWSFGIKYGVCAALLALADILRPESIIPLIAIWLYLFLTLNKTNVREKSIFDGNFV